MRRLAAARLACVALVLVEAAPAAAQAVPGLEGLVFAAKIDCPTKDHCVLYGPVEVEKDNWKFYADHAEYFSDKHVLIATGNVSFSEEGDHLAADWAEFNTETRTGTFYHGFGTATIATTADRSMFGGQEPDMYFYGDTIEKIGEQKYRIRRGGFTTCVQPTPRWELVSDTVIVNVDHYAFLRNPVLRVKGVPLFYLPAAYYPIKKENRATGFLLPTYGTSTYRGFSLSNAFFWAINRSQDATFLHDWFTKTGQGAGAEYRYVAAPGSQGNARFYVLNERPAEISSGSGTSASTPGRRSYEIRGAVSQALGRRFWARGRVDYFSSIETQQLYNTNIYDASRRQRSFTGNVGGTLGNVTVNGGIDRSEYFFGETSSTVSGSLPRIQVSRAERPIGRTPLYVSVGGEFADLVRQGKSGTTTTDQGLTRIDFGPRLRVPFTSLRFLTVNSSVSWRGTYYTESLDGSGLQVDTGLFRHYLDFDSRVVGPVVQRVFLPPASRPGQRYKHLIEPFFNIRHVTAIDNYDEIVKLDGVDYLLGGTTQMSYGVTTRLLAKREGEGARTRELFSAGMSQTYYTNAQASQFDYAYSTSFRGRPPSNFSPIAISGRVTPTDGINGTVRLEYDRTIGKIQSISANGTVSHRDVLQVSAGWSHRLSNIDVLLEYDSLNASTTIRTPGNRVGGNYAFNYDLGRRTFIQNRFTAYYNMQCCGFGVEYQAFNFQGLAIGSVIPQDRRFNFSFTLAGLGTFSNFFGALGGAAR